LGVAHRVWKEDHYLAFSSEAGHAGFAPANQQQTKLLAWLQQQHKHISLEMLLSGRGLPLIYQFFHEVEGIPVSSSVESEMQNNDPAQVITEKALSAKDELSDKTLSCFVEIYGAAAGNVALHYYPVSEVFIAGGIAPKIKDQLLSRGFLEAFTNKGLMATNMEKITIKLIVEEKVGLYGALALARML
jgi:glucokinase